MRFFLRLGPSASEVASHKAVSDLATVLLTAMQKLSLGDEKKAVVSEKEPELKPHAQEVRAAGDEKERSEAETIPADLPPADDVPATVPETVQDVAPAVRPEVGSGSSRSQAGEVSGSREVTKDDIKHMTEDEIIAGWREGLVPLKLINTSNCRTLAMKVRRWCENSSNLTACPNISGLFEGSMGDRRVLLQQWLANDGNTQNLEMNLRLEKEHEETHGETMQLLTVEGMKKAGISE